MLILSIHSMLKTYKSKSICSMAMKFKCHKKYRTSSRETFGRWVILFRLLIILQMLRSRGRLRSIIIKWKRCSSCTLKRWTNCWHLKMMMMKTTKKPTKIKMYTKKWKIPGILKRKSSNRNLLKSCKIILTWSTSWEVAIWQEGRMLLLKIRNLLMLEIITLNLNRFSNPSIRSKLKLKNNLKMTKKIINNTTLRTKDRTEE